MEFLFGEVAELLFDGEEGGGVEVGGEFFAFGGEGEEDEAAVGRGALAFEEAHSDEFVGEAGDVGNAGDEAVADFQYGEALAGVGFFAGEDAEDVVVGGAEVMGFEVRFGGLEELGEGAPEVEVGFLFGVIEGLAFFDFGGE